MTATDMLKSSLIILSTCILLPTLDIKVHSIVPIVFYRTELCILPEGSMQYLKIKSFHNEFSLQNL